MPAFFFEWKDFKGGYYVGPSETTQPTNTWTGFDVTTADDDATLIPSYREIDVVLTGGNTSGGSIVAPEVNTTWSEATYLNDFVVAVGRSATAARVYFCRISTGVVTTVVLPVAGSVAGGAPVLVPAGSDIIAYVAIGNGNLFKVTRSTSTVLTITPGGSPAINFTALALWNARLLAWGSGSDTFIFSNALDFDTWPSLNFISVGFANDGISYLIPRNLDVMIVKPSGWSSLTGVLGASASIRQLNDTLGIVATDPVAQHNNIVYFMASTGFENYSVNLMAIAGQNVDVAAYSRFGLSSSRTDIAKTNLGYLGVTVSYLEGLGPSPDSAGANIYLLNAIGRWQLINVPKTSTVTQNVKYSLARGQISRYGNAQDKNLFLVEVSSGSIDNTLKVIKIRPNSVEPGKQSGSDNPAEGVVRLSDIDSRNPTIIRRVFVEAELIQFPNDHFGPSPDFFPYTGQAQMQVKVNNKAVEDIPFNEDINATSGYSPAYSFTYDSFASLSNRLRSQTRVLRFNTNNASFGYSNQIEIKFSGFRIHRVWVEGDTR